MVNKYLIWVEQINAQVLEVKANNMEDAHEEASRQWKRNNNPTFSDTQLVKDKDSEKPCGKYLGYKLQSGSKAYCGEEVFRGEKTGLDIIYCDKCRKKFISNAKSEIGGKK